MTTWYPYWSARETFTYGGTRYLKGEFLIATTPFLELEGARLEHEKRIKFVGWTIKPDRIVPPGDTK